MVTLEEIAEWASVLTGEARYFFGDYHYYVTEPVKRLMWRVMRLHGQLVAFVGLQGTGKTSALRHIYSELHKRFREEASEEDKKEGRIPVILIKCTKDWQASLKKACMPYIDEYLKEERKQAKEMREKSEFVIEEIKKTKSEERAEILEWAIVALNYANVILIDLPDYSKTDRRLMAKNLSDIELLWEKLSKYQNIVISMQKELFKGHFFLGKMSVIELNPLKPEELIHVFKTQFPDCNLISDDALILLGQLARGVFRRFLKYLGLTIESFLISNEEPPIDAAYVNKVVTVEHVIADMELELHDLFKNANQRRQAIELLYHLRDRKQMNQKEIAEFLDVSLPTAERLVAKLERYVNKERGSGREWLISLKV